MASSDVRYRPAEGKKKFFEKSGVPRVYEKAPDGAQTSGLYMAADICYRIVVLGFFVALVVLVVANTHAIMDAMPAMPPPTPTPNATGANYDEPIANIDNTLSSMAERAGAIDSKMAALNQPIAKLGHAVAAVDARAGAIDSKMTALSQPLTSISGLVTALSARFNEVVEAVVTLARRTSTIAHRMAELDAHISTLGGGNGNAPPTIDDTRYRHRVSFSLVGDIHAHLIPSPFIFAPQG